MSEAFIVNAAGGSWRNDSEYTLDRAKLLDRPQDLEEIDGFRERSARETTRYYTIPWSQRIAAEEWLLGYSHTELIPGVQPKIADLQGAIWDAIAGFDSTPDLAAPVARLRRVIPAQDPERPWLFAEECDLVEGRGAWVESPFVVPRDAEGVLLLDNSGEPLSAPAIHYVANDRHGYAKFVQKVEDTEVAIGDDGEPEEVEVETENTLGPSREFGDGVAVLRVVFRPRDYSVLSDERLEDLGGGELRRYVRRYEDAGLEALPMARLAAAGLVLKFAEGQYASQAVPEAGVQQYPLATLTYEWVDCPDPPRAAYDSCLGKVNSENFDGFRGFPVFPPETLLCLPWKTQEKVTATGRICWSVKYRFCFRPQRWNRFPAGDGRFYKATFGGGADGETVYKKADFNTLFLPRTPVLYIR